MGILHMYKNGNAKVILFSDGTKIRRTEDDEFIPDFSENVDVKITDHCDGGCPMCYEGCTINGKHGDIMNYKFVNSLHKGTEMALNGNDLTHPQLVPFLNLLKLQGVVANLTVNQIHFEQKYDYIKFLVNNGLIRGLGISLKEATDNFIYLVKQFPNAVIHVINGVVTPADIIKLSCNELKLLILGYKQMERGSQYYEDNMDTIKTNQNWLFEHLPNLLDKFPVVSFDNLAIEQLCTRRLMTSEEWNKFYMGDDGSFTFYIDLVEGTFAKNSLVPKKDRIPIGKRTIDEMFKIVRSVGW